MMDAIRVLPPGPHPGMATLGRKNLPPHPGIPGMMAGGMAPPPQAHHIAPISENHHLGAPAPLPPGVSPAPGQLPPGVTADHAEVGEYIFDRLRDCDVDPTAPPHD